MTIFTEGHDPLDQGLDPRQPAGRMPMSKEFIEHIQAQNKIATERQNREDTIVLFAFAVSALVILAVGFRWLSQNRKRVSEIADSAAVSSLAAGIAINRKIQSRRESLVERARAKANEKARKN